MYTVQMAVSGGGPNYDVCKVSTLEEATGVIKLMEVMFHEWERQNYPSSFPRCIRDFEGCDVYAQGPDGLFSYVDEWERVG